MNITDVILIMDVGYVVDKLNGCTYIKGIKKKMAKKPYELH